MPTPSAANVCQATTAVQAVVQVPRQQIYYNPVVRSTEMMARQSLVYVQQPGAVLTALQPQQQVVTRVQRASYQTVNSMHDVDIRCLSYSINAQGAVGGYQHVVQPTSGQARSGRWIFVQDSQILDHQLKVLGKTLTVILMTTYLRKFYDNNRYC